MPLNKETLRKKLKFQEIIPESMYANIAKLLVFSM